MAKEIACFGFYLDCQICRGCLASQRCKSVTTSVGLDLVAEAVDHVLAEMDPNMEYEDRDLVTSVVDLITGKKRGLKTGKMKVSPKTVNLANL